MTKEELFKMLNDMKEKVEKKATATDGEKDNMKKMVKDTIEAIRAEEKEAIRKSKFDVDDEGDKVVSFQKRLAEPARNDLDRELQKFNDDVVITATILKTAPQNLVMWKRYQAGNTELRKALDTATAGEGYEWIPTQFSADVIDQVRLELKVANLFQTITMPTNPYKIPVATADITGYLQAESLADEAAKLRASQPTTGNLELSAKKLAARVVFSEEVAEDSIVPILPWLKKNIVTAIAIAEEKAVINGDTSTTHMDSNVTTTYDAQMAWDGLRHSVATAAKTDISTFTLEYFRNIRKNMGKYGVDPRKLVIVVGMSGFIQLLSIKDSNNNAMVSTIDKYGPNATVLTGELAKIDGMPIIVSEYIYQNLNASGVYDGSTITKTIMLCIYTPAFVMGDRRKVTVKSAVNIETDQQILVCTERKAFKPLYAVTETMIGLGYNLTS